jgi:hypothetical protein
VARNPSVTTNVSLALNQVTNISRAYNASSSWGAVNLGSIVLGSTSASVNGASTHQLQVGDGTETVGSVVVRASLSSRAATVNQIGFVVLEASENASTILENSSAFRARAQTLFSSLEATDATLPAAMAFERDLTLINGQRIQFFEVADSSLDQLTSLADSRLKLLDFSLPSTTSPTAQFTTSSGVSFQLSSLSSNQGLEQMIANDQSVAPVLNFSGFSGGQSVSGTVVMGREASYDSLTGFYRTLNAEGWISDGKGNIITPDNRYSDDNGTSFHDISAYDKKYNITETSANKTYKQLALRTDNLVTALSDLHVANRSTSQKDIVINGETAYLAPYAQVNGNTFFSYAAANADGYGHFRSLGNNLFGLEDFYGGGDRDHDDLVMGFRFQQVTTLPG